MASDRLCFAGNIMELSTKNRHGAYSNPGLKFGETLRRPATHGTGVMAVGRLSEKWGASREQASEQVVQRCPRLVLRLPHSAAMTKPEGINAPDTESGDEAPTIHLHIDELDMARMSANG